MRRCAHCSSEYQPKHHVAMYCAKTCKVQAHRVKVDPLRGKRQGIKRARTHEARQQRAHSRAVAAARSAACGYWAAEIGLLRRLGRICPVCDGQVDRERNGKHCSAACGELGRKAVKAASRLIDKARRRDATVESVNPLKVFKRDGWVCYLCGCETPQAFRGTYEPNAPEVEHVVPLSKGGEHSYANTRCACRACNSIKGSSLPGGGEGSGGVDKHFLVNPSLTGSLPLFC